MQDKVDVSIIVPVYNGEKHIKNCIDVIKNKDFLGTFEVLIVNDASNDNTVNIIQKLNIENLEIYSLKINSGQSEARNFGIKKAVGDYIFFIDVDDTIEKNTLTILFDKAKETNSDFVCADFKRIENLKNQRDGKYNYSQDMLFNHKEIISAMHTELHDPTLGHLGLFGCNGRLIRRSILINNKIFFEKKLRWLEDKTFCWDVLSYINKAIYIKKQLYSYYVYPNVKTAITESLINGFPFSYIKLINKHIKQSLLQRKVSEKNIELLSQQGLIFHSIQILVSISRSMALGKIDLKKGKEIRKVLIKEIFNDIDVKKAIKNYIPSNKESVWIPRAIALRSIYFLEFTCDLRARQVIKKRRKGKE